MKDKLSYKPTIIGTGIGALGGTGMGYYLAKRRIKKSGVDPNSEEAKRLKRKYVLTGGLGGAVTGGLFGANLASHNLTRKIENRTSNVTGHYEHEYKVHRNKLDSLDNAYKNYKSDIVKSIEEYDRIKELNGKNSLKSYKSFTNTYPSSTGGTYGRIGLGIGGIGGAGIGYYLANKRIKRSGIDPNSKEAKRLKLKYSIAGGLGGAVTGGMAGGLAGDKKYRKYKIGEMKDTVKLYKGVTSGLKDSISYMTPEVESKRNELNEARDAVRRLQRDIKSR